LQGELVRLKYKDPLGKEYAYQINLERAKHRPSEIDKRVQIARNATIRVLEKNKNLTEQNQCLSLNTSELQSKIAELEKKLSIHTTKISKLEQENRNLIEQVNSVSQFKNELYADI
jgi:uncharacterized protein (DUF3084 family)